VNPNRELKKLDFDVKMNLKYNYISSKIVILLGVLMNVTIRNIPEEVISKLRTLSKIERRSLNNEIIVVLEKGLSDQMSDLQNIRSNISKELQVRIWRDLAIKWEDDRTTEEIIRDIYQHRTEGREVDL